MAVVEATPSDLVDRRSTVARGAVALVAAAASVAMLVEAGISGTAFIGIAAIGALAVLCVTDIEHHRLPNRIVIPSAVAILAAQTVVHPDRLLEWVVAPMAAFLAVLVLHVIQPSGLGMGDAKLALLLGAILGADVTYGLALGSVAAALFGLGMIARNGRQAARSYIPYGPFLAAGTVAVLL